MGNHRANFHMQGGFLFCANKLCVPASSIHLLLLQEAHGGDLMGHFGIYKMHEVLAGHFFGPGCAVMSSALLHAVLHVRKLSHD